ncbi:hypothetical protein I3842_16G093500 [Carya illinoinensis]|uniref:Uncharacterized protein n=1 Tax=Carya illinoinensis TaxID=32201 RepID=A0A922A654_CARIL|nr:hypothetical protein I3842_16G093500 [Carya illinoinensis]
MATRGSARPRRKHTTTKQKMKFQKIEFVYDALNFFVRCTLYK